jgi:hypothetical protein
MFAPAGASYQFSKVTALSEGGSGNNSISARKPTVKKKPD